MTQVTSHLDHHHAPPPAQTSRNFWFDDGSIIIAVAQDRFKLHKSLLYRQSSLLSSLPVSQADGSLPYVEIPNSLADVKDFTALLGHLYHDTPIEVAPLPTVASILQASSENGLRFQSIYSLAKARFRQLLQPGPGVANFVIPEDPEEALSLAIQHDISSIQKPLYYSVATTSHFEPGIAHPSLPPDVTSRCAALQEQLIAHFTPILFTVATAGHMTCTDIFAETWMADVISPALANNGLCRPVETLRTIQNVHWEDKGVCDECCREKRAEWEEEVGAVWDKLDKWLAL